jgi:pyruvate kinase
MRLTKIVCTLGPSSNSPEMIRSLIEHGMNVARINFSHGTQEGHRTTIRSVKQVREEAGMPVALLLDTKGAEIRTGDVEKPIEVTAGQEVIFSYYDVPGAALPVIRVSYPEFAGDVKEAECILVDNGTMIFDAVRFNDDGSVVAKSRDNGSIGNRRHVNLPGADISLPSMTQQDWSDLENVGIPEEMDYIALSFIRTAAEVDEVKKFITDRGSAMRVITKVETRQAVDNIDAIIASSDGIMVARGDLGAEMPFERIPAVQDMMVAKCRAANKPVIVATHMLESMIKNPMPTRAEVTDIAHAAVTRADATMLSGETAAGTYPLQSIDAMSRTLIETESHLADEPLPNGKSDDERIALADAAVSMADALHTPLIVVITRSGDTARAVSRLRPKVPVLACTKHAPVERSLQLLYGVITAAMPADSTDPETSVSNALRIVKERGLATAGQDIVIIADTPTGSSKVRSVQLRTAL